MDTSVKLHGQAEFATIEIDNVFLNGILAMEFQVKPPPAQQMPVGWRMVRASTFNV
jgi:hypothetical protein